METSAPTSITVRKLNPAGRRAQFGGRLRSCARVAPFLWLMARRFVPRLLATYLPWYTPHRIQLPAEALTLATHYSHLAQSVVDNAAPVPALLPRAPDPADGQSASGPGDERS